jgi:hypothetical protein
MADRTFWPALALRGTLHVQAGLVRRFLQFQEK